MLTPSAVDAGKGLLERLAQARAETDKLFQLVKPERLYERPIAERHRIIFYLGHLEAFDSNLLRESLGIQSTDPSLDRLFAFGIDPVDGGLPSDQPADWPAEPQVTQYGRRIRTKLDEALLQKGSAWDGEENSDVLLHVAIEHRLMHAETFAYMLHRMPFESKRSVIQAGTPDSCPFEPEMIEIPEGRTTLGISRDGNFGWDNEFERHLVDVPRFRIDRYKVTNGQFLDFTLAGGYRDRSLWTDADWRWKEQNGIDHPAFWKRSGSEFRYRAMFEDIPLPFNWPVYVSHAEASAYAAWAGKRLPTEAEWHRAAYDAPDGERAYPWGEFPPAAEHGYLDMNRWDPSPVNAFPKGRSHWGVDGMLSNGWEWTSSQFGPFPGFQAFPFYRGYSADFFDGKHYVMKGGSPRTELSMLRRSFRNWFQPHYPYAYVGFRCATDD